MRNWLTVHPCLGKGVSSIAGSSSSFSYYDKQHRQAFARFMAAKWLNLNFADNPHWDQFVQTSFYPEFQRPSRTTTQRDMIEYYEWKRTEFIGRLVEMEQRMDERHMVE